MPKLRKYRGERLHEDKAKFPVGVSLECKCDLRGICECIAKELAQCRGECPKEEEKTIRIADVG